MAAGDHARGKDVALLVDHALAVAVQGARALQALVQELGVGLGGGAQLGVVDLQVAGGRQPQGLQGLPDAVLASDQDRRAVARGAEGDGGADALFLFALGEDDPSRVVADLLEDGLEGAQRGIEAGRQFVAVGLHVDDGLARHAGIHGRLGHRLGDRPDQAGVERRRDDVFGSVAQVAAPIRRVHFVGHVFAGEVGEGVGGGDLHGVVDGAGAHVQGPAEDVGEPQHVVDLVGIIGAPGGDDGVRADRLDLGRRDLRLRIGHGEDDRFVGHGFHHRLGHHAPGGKAQEHIRALHGLGQGAGLGVDRVGRLPLVHAFGAAPVDDSLGIAQDRVVRRQAHGFQQLHAGDGGGAGAVDHQACIFQGAAGEVEGVDQAGGDDDGGAVLVVVEDRNVHELADALLDDEAFRGLDVFQVDAAEGRADVPHAVDELVHVLGVHFQVDSVDVGEPLEQDRLAFHHRLGPERAEVAQPEHRRAVGDDRDQVALGRVVVDQGRVPGDLEAGRGDARRIGHGQIALGDQRLGGPDFVFPRPAAGVQQQRLAVGDVVGKVVHGVLFPQTSGSLWIAILHRRVGSWPPLCPRAGAFHSP